MAPAPRRFYTSLEVAKHDSVDDCWLSLHGIVLDVTELLKAHTGALVEPIIKAAGSDVSHWFKADAAHDVKTHVDPVTNLIQPYCPQGRFLHVPPMEATSDWDTSFGSSWWQDEQYKIGLLSTRCRMVKIQNVLTKQEHQLEVPCEELLSEIRVRYLDLNKHAFAYTWKAIQKGAHGFELFELDMNGTLAENGIKDETNEFEAYMIEPEAYIPVLHLYWSDDLTRA